MINYQITKFSKIYIHSNYMKIEFGTLSPHPPRELQFSSHLALKIILFGSKTECGLLKKNWSIFQGVYIGVVGACLKFIPLLHDIVHKFVILNWLDKRIYSERHSIHHSGDLIKLFGGNCTIHNLDSLNLTSRNFPMVFNTRDICTRVA